jgi:phage terminase Nu1 subunit (DNA packaging protein)
MQVNQRQLAEIIGVTDTCIISWERVGMPVLLDVNENHGNVKYYDTATCIAWLRAWEKAKAQKSMETSKDRLDRIRGDREELALAKDLGEVLPTQEIERILTFKILEVRYDLLNLSDPLAAEINARYGVMVDPDIIQAKVEQVLTKLSQRRFTVEDLDNADLDVTESHLDFTEPTLSGDVEAESG